MVKILSFAPSKLTLIYLRRIMDDLKETRPSPLLNKLVSEFFILKYGKEARDEARKEYTEQIFGD